MFINLPEFPAGYISKFGAPGKFLLIVFCSQAAHMYADLEFSVFFTNPNKPTTKNSVQNWSQLEFGR